MGKQNSRKIKPPREQSVQGRIANPSSAKRASYDDCTPVFCLRYLQAGFDLDACDRKQQADFAKALWKRSRMTWRQIWASDRHGLGAEKIARGSVRTPIPVEITEDVEFFVALRFSGKAPMVGYRIRDVFHMVWLDSRSRLYNHR